jgi:hypothetical protein
MVHLDAAALRRRVLHSGVPFGVVMSAPFDPLSALLHVCGLRHLLYNVVCGVGAMVCISSLLSLVEFCATTELMSQSNRQVLSGNPC